MDIHHIHDVAVQAAKTAAELILSDSDKQKSVNYKGRTDLVTHTDKKSEQLICTIINESFPDHGILAEESKPHLPNANYQWIIDPLDGTTNFVHNYPSFAVSIGVHYKKSPVVGCVIEISSNNIFTAIKKEGAFCNNNLITVSSEKDLQKSLLVTGFGYKHGDKWKANMNLFKSFTDITQGVRRLGAASVDLCHVACGNVDGFWEFDLHPWDTAAGIMIVLEAGGIITQMDGKGYDIFQNQILASNGQIHGAMLKNIKPIIDSLNH